MKMDPKHAAYGFGLVMMSLGLAACAGFDLGDMVKVKTPNTIQQTRGLPRTTTLNEASLRAPRNRAAAGVRRCGSSDRP